MNEYNVWQKEKLTNMGKEKKKNMAVRRMKLTWPYQSKNFCK